MPLGQERKRAWWSRARATEVAPIGLIVVVAILAIIASALTSAHRADEAAFEQERRLIVNTVEDRRVQLVREAENIITSNEAVRRMWLDFDPRWAHARVGLRLKTYFEHDQVFVVDPSDRFVYALVGDQVVDAANLGPAIDDLRPVIDGLRGRDTPGHAEAERASIDPSTGVRRRARLGRVQKFIGRAAIVGAVAMTPADESMATPPGPPPLVITVDVIDDNFLGKVGAQLKLSHLRELKAGAAPPSDRMFDLLDDNGRPIARFAWTPTRPGADILDKMLPFIVLATASLGLLTAFALRYMSRTAATISKGEDRLRYLALHDALSGLPNRAYFGERLESVIQEVNQGGSPAAVFCIDLDHFKDVNDTLGHHVGDELIGAVTRRLRNIVRDEALVARLGGDEFAIIAPGATDASTLMMIADRIIASLCAPYNIINHTILIGASIGIALIDRPSLSAADIMRYADMALYRAKNEGRRRACIYDAAMDADLLQRKVMENDLRDAIANDGLNLVYQPVFSADGEKIVCVEALTRWNHPTRGEIPPSEFIPSAEQSGLIIPLGEWALRRACIDAGTWPVTLAVNVSPLQFRRPDFVEVVERTLAETGFDPTRLELELTESTLLGNVDGAEAAMRRLKALGVKLALDDFGTGYSSLLYLRRLPFDKLKIDGSFVQSIDSAAEAAPIVHAIVSLGRGLGMKVTAEGVETAEQHLFLRAAGVHFMQGFRFGMPERAVIITTKLLTQAAQDAKSPAIARAG
jgi:diguanylate cyclase (GGDEF)-like protein